MNAPNVHTVEIQAKLQWQYYRDESSKRWIAVCDPLKVTIEADTHAELIENIEDGLNLLFRSLLRDNELEQFLRMRGWSIDAELPSMNEEVRFDVPIELIARQANGLQTGVH